jgi:transposase
MRMSQPLDLSQFPDLPPEAVKAFAAQQAALATAQFEASVERAARQHERAVVAEKDAFITELKALIEKLEGQVQDYRRTKFGPKSEKLDPAQLELALEDPETAIAETQAQIAAVEDRIAASEPDPEKRAPRKAWALPESLPRLERVLEPDSIACPCGCGDMVWIGEDRTERLDYIPARYQVIITVRPKYACPKGRTCVVQVKAPAHLLEGPQCGGSELAWTADAPQHNAIFVEVGPKGAHQFCELPNQPRSRSKVHRPSSTECFARKA